MGGRHRKLRISWWPQEAITWGQAEYVMAGGPADYMLTHDAPIAAKVPGLDEMHWDPVELLTAEQHRELLQHVVEAVSPSHLWHGHMHVRYGDSIETARGHCVVNGLDSDQGRLGDNVILVDLTADPVMSIAEPYAPLACPECRAGKHYNCSGDTWDDELDALVECPCYANGHRPTGDLVISDW